MKKDAAECSMREIASAVMRTRAFVGLSRFVSRLSAGLLTSVCLVHADDWPQWRGPERNGVSRETGLLKEWPKEGPRLLWKRSDIGSGFSTPSVVGESLYLLSNEGMDKEYVQAHAISDGRLLWRTVIGKVGANPAQMNYAAARSTPTVEGEYLYALGSDGEIVAVAVSDGKIRWQKNLVRDFGGKPGDWAYAESPLIDGKALICTPGGSEATVIALNKDTGEILWKCGLAEGDQAAFASPIVLSTGGIRQYVQLLQKGLVGIEAGSGKSLWRYPRPTSRFNANIPTPLASGDAIYVGSAGTGGGLVRLVTRNGKITPEEVYFESKLPTAIGGVVKVGEYLYGTTAQALLCVEFATGTVKWQERGIGAASICYADGRLYLHGENGEAALVEPSPEGYFVKGRFTPPEPAPRANAMEKAWVYPVVANGRFYLRDHGMLWSYGVR